MDSTVNLAELHEELAVSSLKNRALPRDQRSENDIS